MIKHHVKGLSTIPGNQVEPENFEQLKRNKTDIENNHSKILKIIKNEDQGIKRGRRPKWSKQETELVGLIENFFTQYQLLYTLCDRLTAENSKIVSSRIDSGISTSFSCSSSDSSDYFSSNEVESPRNSPETENHHQHEMEGLRDHLNVMHQNLKSLSDKNKELESQMGCLNQKLIEQGLLEQRMREQSEGFAGKVMALEMELESRYKEKEKLEEELRQKNYEIKQLRDENKSLEDMNLEMKRQVTHAGEELNNLKLELDYYKEEKMRLELQQERIQKEYSESHEKIIEEIEEEMRGQLEDSVRLLYRRIHVAEQLHNESKDGYKVVKDRYEEENKMLREKIDIYEEIVAGFRDSKLKPIEVLNVLELANSKLGDSQVGFQKARDWTKQRKEEMEKMKTNVDELVSLVNDKEERVEKLEAKVMEGGEENLNLMKLVTELKEKVGMLEKMLKEKDEDLVNLGETKREAIKQLCFVNDYHRQRCEFLKGLISKKNTLITRA